MKVNFAPLLPPSRASKPRAPKMFFDTLGRPALTKRTESKGTLNYHLGSFKATLCGELADYLPGVYGPNVLKLDDWKMAHPVNQCQQCKFLLAKSLTVK